MRTEEQFDRPLNRGPLTRRGFLRQAGLTIVAAASAGALASCGSDTGRTGPPKVLVRALWQQVNIGDVAQAPGLLSLLAKHIPNAEVTLWPATWNDELSAMITPAFPDVSVVATERDVVAAFRSNDCLIHGSGPGLVGRRQLGEWVQDSDKPYSVYGITLASPSALEIDLLNGAASAFFRDSGSLAVAESVLADDKEVGFAPDAAFAFNLRNDSAAERFLAQNGLADGRFMCVIPRLRYTPYWDISGQPYNRDQDERNQAMKGPDHVLLREAIVEIVRQTSLRILICPEDVSQTKIGRELLFDPLPDDVKGNVVIREQFWLPNEALSVYVRSAGLFGNEMHSPVICIGNGVPAIVCRSAEQTTKGMMWNDIGLGEWLFDLDDPNSMRGLVPAVLKIAHDPAWARQKAGAARELVQQKQQVSIAEMAQSLSIN